MRRNIPVTVLIVIILLILIIFFERDKVNRFLLSSIAPQPVKVEQKVQTDMEPEPKSSFSEVFIAGQSIRVDLVATEADRTRGLSGRTGLDRDQGMLFVFDVPAIYGFWMKDMLFPIDIIWISENGLVVDIKESAEPSSYPEIFSPKAPAKYVLEVNAGFSREFGLKIGDSVTLR